MTATDMNEQSPLYPGQTHATASILIVDDELEHDEVAA